MIDDLIGLLRRKFDKQSKILFKNTSWVFIAKVVAIGTQLIQSLILARIFGVAIFGVYIVMITFVEVVQEFLNFNIDMALIKYSAEYHAKERNEYIVSLVKVSLLITGFTTILVLLVVSLSTHQTSLDLPL